MSLPVNITLNDTTLLANETALVTIFFNEESVFDLEPEDLISQDGTFSNLQNSGEGASWTAIFTPNPGVETSEGVISLSSSIQGGASSSAFTIDTLRPTASIVLADSTLTANETSLVTITFNQFVTGFTNADLTVEGGTLSAVTLVDEGTTYTATFTPAAGLSDTTNVITLHRAGVSDQSGNAGEGTATSSNYVVNTAPAGPTATVSIADTALRAGEGAYVSFAFSETVSGFALDDVTVGSGVLSNLTTSDNKNYQAYFTPGNGIETTDNLVSVNLAGVTGYNSNIAGTGTATSQTYAVDSKAPTVTVVVADDILSIGQSSTVAITFSEAIDGLELNDFQAQGGALSNLHQTSEGVNTHWEATFTPTADLEGLNQKISLNGAGISDLAGNRVVGFVPSNLYTVDTKAPTATIAIDDTALKIGDTPLVTITFSEAVHNLAVEDFQVDGGTLSNLQSDEGDGLVWTATFTPSSDTNAIGQHITLNGGSLSDLAGNGLVEEASSNAYATDTKAPTVMLSISDDNLTANQTATVTVTFSEAVLGMGQGKVSMSNGTLSAFTDVNEGLTWQATFTPTAGVTSNNNLMIFDANGVTDLAGNTILNGPGTIGYYSVNTGVAPTGPTATVSIDDTALNINDGANVTITFSEQVTGFDLNDISVGSGTLGNLTPISGNTYSAYITPTAGVESFGNKVSVNLAGVTGYASSIAGTGSAQSQNYSVDTKAPTATVVMADSALTAGETSQVTITFSEYVTQFDALDLTAQNGTLGALSTSDEGRTWHTTFTPTANVSDATNVVSLNMGGLSDWAGNHGVGTATSSNYTVNTTPPVVVTPTPTPPVLVDGVSVKQTSGTAADGSKTQVVTVPTVTTGRVDKDGTAALADIPLVKTTGGDSLLSVGVPVGFGVKASGSTTAKAASDSLTNLIAEIKAHSTNGSAAQESMVGGGSGFLAALDKAPLLVQTIVVSAPSSTDVSKGALVVSGNAGAGTPQTALVIDAKALPTGATIELQNVDFAAIIGAVTLRGGEGKQTIFGDSASQNIFLGADDDILHGGAGNDIVGSAGGNDQIFGDEGDDIVFGGEGNDLIDGGTGFDIVRMAGAGRADYSFRINDGKLVTTHLKGGIDGTDIVGNVEALRFAGASTDVAFRDTDVASLVRMYETAFDRNADEGGLNFWIGQSEAGVSLHDIAVAMVNSTEAQAHFKGMTDAAFIQALYLQGLDRAGTAEESKIWIDSLESGAVSRGTALLGFADSAEKIALVGFMDTSIVTA